MLDIFKPKKNPLGGKKKMEGDRTYSSRAISTELKDKGLAVEETITVKNPVTKKTAEVTIQRDGTPESKLIMALADKNLKRDQKDHVLSMYLFERGKESSSFLVDLMRFKGTHTKETRAFTSQMRFDFEAFLTVFRDSLESSSKAIIRELGFDDEEFKEFTEQYIAYVKETKDDTVIGFLSSQGSVRIFKSGKAMKFGIAKAALIQIAIRQMLEAEKLHETVNRLTKSRESARGQGIYVDLNGSAYSIHEDDVSDIVAKDKERLAELEQEDN